MQQLHNAKADAEQAMQDMQSQYAEFEQGFQAAQRETQQTQAARFETEQQLILVQRTAATKVREVTTDMEEQLRSAQHDAQQQQSPQAELVQKLECLVQEAEQKLTACQATADMKLQEVSADLLEQLEAGKLDAAHGPYNRLLMPLCWQLPVSFSSNCRLKLQSLMLNSSCTLLTLELNSSCIRSCRLHMRKSSNSCKPSSAVLRGCKPITSLSSKKPSQPIPKLQAICKPCVSSSRLRTQLSWVCSHSSWRSEEGGW